MSITLGRLCSWPLRAWRSRGFGIHSPFAYEFVTEVIHQPYGYYAYQRLDNLLDSHPQSAITRSGLYLIYRLALWAQAERYIQVGGKNGLRTQALRLGVPKGASIKVVSALKKSEDLGKPPTMLLLENAALVSPAQIAEVVEGHGLVVALNLDNPQARQVVDDAMSLMKQGMTFTNGVTTILVGRQGLPRQDFKVAF
ncbi:MAG: hypothetical protein LIO90_04890 [Bacteroidales bacterium]|nr:hypothetical protein [Bacteroidales bacterium]